jgi:hypothetical protein
VLVSRLKRAEEELLVTMDILGELGGMLGIEGLELSVHATEPHGVHSVVSVGDRIFEGKEALLMYHGALIVLGKTKPTPKGKR